MEGIIKFWNNNWGFIIAEDNNEYFVSIQGLQDTEYHPQRNDKVTFEIGENKKGFCCINVRSGHREPEEVGEVLKKEIKVFNHANGRNFDEAEAIGGHC
jgi:cold shock CspA family protein